MAAPGIRRHDELSRAFGAQAARPPRARSPRPLRHRHRHCLQHRSSVFDRSARPAACRCRAVCLGRRLPRHRASAAGRIARLDAPGRSRAVRVASLCRYRANPGARLRAVCGHRVDRQELLSDRPRARLVALSRLSHLQPAPRTGHGRIRSVRRVHGLPHGLSDWRDRRAARARCDALHLLSHDRAGACDSRDAAAGHAAT